MGGTAHPAGMLASRLARGPAAREHGLTLIELMVALAIGLAISIAASAVYLSTRSVTRVTQSVSDLGETGQLALELLGREIKKAGFYPAQFGAPGQPLMPGAFVNSKDAANAIFNQGVFGCQGANFDPVTKACSATVAGAPDSLVINYLSAADFGDSSVIGNHRDCNRAVVTADASNTAAAAAGRPLYVSNRYGLVSTSYTAVAGNAVNTRSLACHGNGNDDAVTLTPQLAGIEDLVLSYGVYNAAAQQTPGRFYTAAEVSALPTVDELTPWQRVSAIRVCLVARTPDAVRQGEKAGQARTFRDCRGADVALSNTDRTLLRRFERVFAVRNNLKAAL